MDGLTVRPRAPKGTLAWQGVILPRCIPTTKAGLRAPLWNHQTKGAFALPWNP